MPGEPENQFSLTRAALRTGGRAKSEFLSVRVTKCFLLVISALLVGGCQRQSKPGEAFVVLGSGEVIYMADMEVVCLRARFRGDFRKWRSEYESQDKSIVREIESGAPPAVTDKLRELD